MRCGSVTFSSTKYAIKIIRDADVYSPDNTIYVGGREMHARILSQGGNNASVLCLGLWQLLLLLLRLRKFCTAESKQFLLLCLQFLGS